MRRERIAGRRAGDHGDGHGVGGLVTERDAKPQRKDDGKGKGPEHGLWLAQELAEAHERELRERTVTPATRRVAGVVHHGLTHRAVAFR